MNHDEYVESYNKKLKELEEIRLECEEREKESERRILTSEDLETPEGQKALDQYRLNLQRIIDEMELMDMSLGYVKELYGTLSSDKVKSKLNSQGVEEKIVVLNDLEMLIKALDGVYEKDVKIGHEKTMENSKKFITEHDKASEEELAYVQGSIAGYSERFDHGSAVFDSLMLEGAQTINEAEAIIQKSLSELEEG